MKASVIIAIYKDVQSLSLIIDALKRQTVRDFEVVIAEDGDDKEVKAYVDSITGLRVKHTSQEDSGIRKSRSQNNGILASEGEYLIFIDGDCIPYSTFVEAHLVLREKGKVLSGRRVNLGARISSKLRNRSLDAYKLEKSFLLNYWRISRDEHASHIEQGIYLKPKGWLYNLISGNRSATVLGCNFSIYRDEMLAVNGFDESYPNTSLGDDVDLSWRFKAAGLQEKSCKNSANQFHLDHTRGHQNPTPEVEMKLMNERKARNEFKTKNGLNLH